MSSIKVFTEDEATLRARALRDYKASMCNMKSGDFVITPSEWLERNVNKFMQQHTRCIRSSNITLAVVMTASDEAKERVAAVTAARYERSLKELS
jgi:hypothetical protein